MNPDAVHSVDAGLRLEPAAVMERAGFRCRFCRTTVPVFRRELERALIDPRDRAPKAWRDAFAAHTVVLPPVRGALDVVCGGCGAPARLIVDATTGPDGREVPAVASVLEPVSWTPPAPRGRVIEGRVVPLAAVERPARRRGGSRG